MGGGREGWREGEKKQGEGGREGGEGEWGERGPGNNGGLYCTCSRLENVI